MGPTPLPPSKAPAKAALLGRRMFKRELGLSRFLDLPLLRKQKSFTDEITLSPGSLDAIAISLWENKANAEAYNTNAYPEVLRTYAAILCRSAREAARNFRHDGPAKTPPSRPQFLVPYVVNANGGHTPQTVSENAGARGAVSAVIAWYPLVRSLTRIEWAGSFGYGLAPSAFVGYGRTSGKAPLPA